MKKVLSLSAIILILTVLVLLLASQIKSMQKRNNVFLNSDMNSTPIAEKRETPVEIKLSYWSLGYTKGFEEALKRFNDTNSDNIRLSLLQIPQFMYEETLNMLMASGEGPDIIGLNEGLLNSYVSRSWLANLKSYIESDFFEKFPDWALSIAADPIYENKLYAVPSSIVTYRLIYNKDLFAVSGLNPDQPPSTIAELRDYAIKISKACKGERKYGFALPAGGDWTGFVQSMEGPATYSGVYYFDYRKGKFDLTVYNPWLQAIIDMKNNGGMFPGDSSLKSNTARMQFSEGNIGMMFATSWEPAVLSLQYPSNCSWDVSMPPALDEGRIGKGAVIISAGSCYAINSKCRNMPETVKAWKSLYSEDFQRELYRTGSELPIFKEILDNDTYKPDIKNYDKFVPSDIDSPYPSILNGFDRWSRMRAYSSIITGTGLIPDTLIEENLRLNELFNSSLWLNKTSVEEYMNKDFNPQKPLGNK